MERFAAVVKLGLRYLHRYRRRYFFLFAALVVGFAIVTFITTVKDGMYDSVYYAAQSHYAGDIIVVGYEAASSGGFTHRLGRDEAAAILEAADRSGINPRHTVVRTMQFGQDTFLHFNGNAIGFRYLIGCDWEAEAHLFNKMIFDEPPDPVFGDDGIVISAAMARQLGARMGDMVILEAATRFGQKNTGAFVVRGIVRDTSIFGYYKAYISRPALNRFIVYGDDCSSIGFFFDDTSAIEQKRAILQEALAGRVQIGPLVYDRDGMAREADRPWDGIMVFLYTLPVYLSEISYLLDAMNLLTYFLYGMMLLTILASAAVTYRLILHERSREMGVMRAIGFYGGDLRLVLWTEIIVLGLVSMLAGFLLAALLNQLASLLSFSWFPGFEIFLKDGRLRAMYLPSTMLTNAALLLLVLVTLAIFPSFRVSRKSLPALLSGEPL